VRLSPLPFSCTIFISLLTIIDFSFAFSSLLFFSFLTIITLLDAVIALETALASAHLTRTAGRDPELTYNKMSISHLATITQPDITYAQYLTTGVAEKGFDWKKYFALIGRDETAMGDVNAACVDALKKASVLSASPSLPHYLCFHAVNSSAQHLSSEFVNAHFNFHDKELKGTTEIRYESSYKRYRRRRYYTGYGIPEKRYYPA
jgi:predicted metalloendopeptidase